MRSAGVSFLLALFVAAALTPLIRKFALDRGLLDHAIDSRKIHGRPVPRLGGIAIVLGFFAPLFGVCLLRPGLANLLLVDERRAAAFLAGALAIAALGLYDDVRGAGAVKKLSVQLGVGLLLWQCGFRIENIATPLGVTVPLGAFGLPLTLLWIAGVVNAMNLIDGLDGLAGGVALFALGTNFAVAAFRGDALMAFLTATLGGAVLGFLVYNWNPASIFMGDTGSMFLGFVLAAGSIQASQKSSTAVSLLVPVVALGLPIADTLLALLRRASRGRPLFSADKEHIHHRLLALGLTHRQSVVALYAASAVLGATALLLSFANSWQTAALLCGLSAVGLVGLKQLGRQSKPQTGENAAAQRRRNREVRAEVRAIGDRLQRATALAEVWEAVHPFGRAVGAQGIALEVVSRRAAGAKEMVRHGLAAESPTGPCHRAQFALAGDDDAFGQLELSWTDGRREVDRADELAAEILCDHITAALERIEPLPRENVIALPRSSRQGD